MGSGVYIFVFCSSVILLAAAIKWLGEYWFGPWDRGER